MIRITSVEGTYVNLVWQCGKTLIGEVSDISFWTLGCRLINSGRKLELSRILPTQNKLIGSGEIEPDPIVGASVKRRPGNISGKRGEIGVLRKWAYFRNLGHISGSDVNPDVHLPERKWGVAESGRCHRWRGISAGKSCFR